MSQTARNVTMRPATIMPFTQRSIYEIAKRRTVGYARVYTDSEEQLNSYEAQLAYYTDYIQQNPNWEFVKVYADEGITGTNTKHRKGFNQMIADALAGKFDLIVTKTIARFARNTVDTLATIRKLKDAGVEVYFQNQNIYTFDSKGEVLITIMASLAQDESRSISENVTWGHRKRFADGKILMPFGSFLGYEKGADGKPAIVEEEADVVRLIYRKFLEGMTPLGIAKRLTELGVPTPGKSKTDIWRTATVLSILSNEKYKGDALLQKKFTVDFLQKKMKKNEGEVPQYYVQNSHPAIIEPLMFDQVQQELARRKELGASYSGASIFATRIVCSDCGGLYGSKVWGSNTKYRRTIWRCNRKYENDVPCSTPHVTEDEIKAAFVTVMNKLLAQRESILASCRAKIAAIKDDAALTAERVQLVADLDNLAAEMHRHIMQNAHEALNQGDYNARHESMAARFQDLKRQVDGIDEVLAQQCAQRIALEGYVHALEQAAIPLTSFDDKMWTAVVDRVTVYHGKRLVFGFKDASRAEWR